MVSMRSGSKNNSRKKELEEQEWYHGFRSRKDVTVLIREPGAFLLRATDSTNFTTIVISVMNEKREIHHLTIIFANGLWQLGVLKDREKNARGFKKIVDLVKYYREHPLPIKINLRKAVARPSWLVKHEQVSYEEKDLLGSGNFCNVYKGIYRRTGETHDVAIKICHSGRKGDNVGEDRKNAQKAITSEAEVMSYYVHNHIIQFYGLACDHPPILIVMEFCPGGSLDKLLRREKENISLAEKFMYSLEAARGMRYLHSQNCIHKDLAARNCLISANGYIKIADFGLSKIVGSEDDVDFEKGGPNTQIPLRWMAPESLKKPMEFSSKTDVWSFSILLYEIFNYGIKPWADDSIWHAKKIAGQIRKCQLPDLPEQMPKDIIEMVKAIWVPDAESRPTMKIICCKLAGLLKVHPAPSNEKLIVNKIEGVLRTQTTLDTTELEEDNNFAMESKQKTVSHESEGTQKTS